MNTDSIQVEEELKYLPKKNLYICGIGVVCILIGLLVIVGWYTHKPFLIQLYPTFAPMQFNAAIGFVISGLGLISACLGKKHLTILFGSLVSLLALLTFVQFVLNIDLGIDKVFIEPYITTQSAPPGRMSPVTAICFILVGISLLSISNPKHALYRTTAWLTATSVWAFSLTVLFGFISQLQISYGWGQFTKMALHTAICFFLLGIGLMVMAWNVSKHDVPLKNKGLIIAVILCGLIISIGLWQAQLAFREDNLRNTIYLETQNTRDIIVANIKERAFAIERMTERWNKRGGIPQSEWESDAANFVDDFQNVQTIAWIDKSYRVRWLIPLRGNEKALNADLSVEEYSHATLDQVREQRSMKLTKAINLAQGKGIIVAAPVFRNSEFDGFIVGTLQLQTMIDRALASKNIQGLDIMLYEGAEEIYRSGNTNSGLMLWAQEIPLSFYDVNWRVQIIPQQRFMDRSNSKLPKIVLIIGLFITALFALTTYLAQHARNRAVEAERINKQLTKADKQLRYAAFVVESSGEAIIGGTMEGIITSWNKGAERIYGYTEEETLGKHISIIFPLSKSNDLQKLFDRIRQGSKIEGYETERRRKNGQIIKVSLSLSPIKNAGGKIIGISSVSRDITAQKQMEEDLLKNEATLNELFESSPDAILLVNEEGRIVRANTQAKNLFGYTNSDLMDKKIELLLPMRYQTSHLEHRKIYAQSPHPRQMGVGFDLYAMRADGSEFPVDVKLSPMKVGKEQFVIATVRDITERKVAEVKIQSSLDEKVLLLKEIHHRVKNNLQIVSSLLHLQSDYIKDEQVLQLFNESSNRVRSMALIHELLYQEENLADIEMGKYLRELTSHLFHTYGVDHHAVSCKITTYNLKLDIDTAVPCGLIFNELISNSLKYAFPNNAKGEISVEMQRDRQGRITVTVSDNGVGLQSDFDITQTKTLGLQLVRNLTRQLKGDLTIERKSGTRFIISFNYN